MLSTPLSTKEDEQENKMEAVKEDSTTHTIKLCRLPNFKLPSLQSI